MGKDRIKYLDYAKGFAIILVIFGHVLYYPIGYESSLAIPFAKWIYSFHIPIFFIISGILLAYKFYDEDNIKFDYKEKVKKLIVPYYIFSLINIIIIAIQTYFNGGDIKTEFLKYFKYIFNFEGVKGTWFLVVIFLALLIFTLIYNGFRKKSLLITFGLFLLVFIFKDINSLQMIFRVFLAIFYISIGFFSKKIIENKKISIWLILGMIGLGVVYSKYLGITEFKRIQLNDPIIYLCTSLLSSYGFILLFKKLSTINIKEKILKPLEYVGKNSLIVFATHMIMIPIFDNIYHSVFNNRNNFFDKPMVYGLIITFCILVIELIIVYVINFIKNRGHIHE